MFVHYVSNPIRELTCYHLMRDVTGTPVNAVFSTLRMRHCKALSRLGNIVSYIAMFPEGGQTKKPSHVSLGRNIFAS
jgi:hypothetical protein